VTLSIVSVPTGADRGAVDVSIEMLFGTVVALLVMLLVFDASAYWHARNVFDDAAADGVRIAAAHGGRCDEAVAATRDAIEQHAGGWGRDATVSCIDGPVVSVTVEGSTPGVLSGGVGLRASVTESQPREP